MRRGGERAVGVETVVAVEDPDEEDPEMHFFRTSGTGGCSGWGCSTATRTGPCGFSGLRLELDPEPECELDLRAHRSRPLSAVRLPPSFSPLASRSRSLMPTLPMLSPTFPSGLPALRLSRSENDGVRVILRPRGCPACEVNDDEDAERPRVGAGSDGARKVVPVAWAGALAREATVTELEGATLVIVSFGEGVRERDLLRDLECDLDRGMSG